MSRAIYVFITILMATMPCSVQKVHAQSAGASSYVQFDKSRRNVIIFVHGVTGDARDTWTNTATGAYWPDLIRLDSQIFFCECMGIQFLFTKNWSCTERGGGGQKTGR